MDLILEYGVSVAAIAVGWGANLNAFLDITFGVALPETLTTSLEDGGFNLPAVLIVLAITFLLVRGVKETAALNNIMVVVKLAVLALFIVLAYGLQRRQPAAVRARGLGWWCPRREHWRAGRRGHHLLRLHRLRCGVDGQRGQEPGARPALRHHRVAGHLHDHLHPGVRQGGRGAAGGALAATDAPLSEALEEGVGLSWAASLTAFGALVAITSVLLVILYGQTRIFFRDGARRPGAGRGRRSTRGTGRRRADHRLRHPRPLVAALLPLGVIVEMVNIRTLFAFILVNAGVMICAGPGRTWSDRSRLPVPYLWCTVGIILCIYLMLGLPVATYIRFVVWLAIGVVIYLVYGYSHSRLRHRYADVPDLPDIEPDAEARRRPAPPPGRDRTTTSRVVVGYDGSEASEDALAFGLTWCRSTGDVPIVATVYPEEHQPGARHLDLEWATYVREQTEIIQQRARDTAADAALYRRVASTSAAHGLADLAENVGSRHGDRGRKPGEGPRPVVAGRQRRAASARCDGTGHGPTGRLAAGAGPHLSHRVAYIDTRDAREALRAAVLAAQRIPARLTLYSVVGRSSGATPTWLAEGRARHRRDRARSFGRALRVRRGQDSPGTGTANGRARGAVVESLAGLGPDDVDLLVCGSRGYGPARRVLLGGVSSRLIRRARLPVTVVPRGP